MIKGLKGGGAESIGSVLNVTNVSTKEQKVTVQHLNGTLANEATLPFSRVIVVELVVHICRRLIPLIIFLPIRTIMHSNNVISCMLNPLQPNDVIVNKYN